MLYDLDLEFDMQDRKVSLAVRFFIITRCTREEGRNINELLSRSKEVSFLILELGECLEFFVWFPGPHASDCQPVQLTSEDSSHRAQHVYSRQRLQSLSQGQTTP
uniref:Uncharacterized protein n=1 Tax=Tanacetum cinerariifolium TaxID=118510 RepID=A0A699JLV7_TANCI|nr:hypothetical protein [Tanacetum cinerariifolium]